MLGTSAKAMRAAQTGLLWRVASTRMPTKWGMFDAIGYERDMSNDTRRVAPALEQSAQSQCTDAERRRGGCPTRLRGRTESALVSLPADQKGKNGPRTEP